MYVFNKWRHVHINRKMFNLFFWISLILRRCCCLGTEPLSQVQETHFTCPVDWPHLFNNNYNKNNNEIWDGGIYINLITICYWLYPSVPVFFSMKGGGCYRDKIQKIEMFWSRRLQAEEMNPDYSSLFIKQMKCTG